MGGSAQRVLGVDPGLTRCGIGVVDSPPSQPRAIAAEVVHTPADLPVEQRLVALHAAIGAAIERHRPTVVACERVLFSANARTAMGVGQAAGVALLAAAQRGLPVASYSPTEVKLTIAGHGGADKAAVARMVAAQLQLSAPPRPADVADAFAVALTHLVRAGAAPASATAVAAAADAAARGYRGWETVLDRPHLRVSGGTADAPGRGGCS